MKHSLTHLPENKQVEIRKLVSTIRKSCADIEKIILYGSYARGTFKEAKDLEPDRKSGHISDYDILVVTGEEDSIRDFNNWNESEKLNLSADVRISAIDIENLNKRLEESHYLYSDIEKEGVMLFDTKKHKLSPKRKLKIWEQQKIAQDYFDHWFERSEDFVETFRILLKKGRYESASFHLHQIAECCYKAILLVFSGYNPNEHHLKTLSRMAMEFNGELVALFPQKTTEEQERFKLLEYAYIGGRYDPKYKISKEDLEILTDEVEKLSKITKKICEKKILSFKP
ncbi:MAG: HEPN domain-containing protein [Pseudomonadota bacterium]